MYVSFFNLREQPFNLTPDPRFLFLSPQHEEALEHLLYGISERKGFIEITGEVGTGKTLLCRTLLERLDDTVSTALIFNSYLTEIELLQAILSDFGLTCEEQTRKAYIDTLNQYLLDEFAAGHNAVVIVDETQNVEPTVLEQLRMLSNLETDSVKLLQVVLIGQPELRDKLATRQMRQLDQRIAVRYHIHGLSRAETQHYVLHRLSVAGTANSVTFSSRAWTLIHRHCGGIPRRINLLCDRILMTAYVRGVRYVKASIVRQSIRDLGGPSYASAHKYWRGAPRLSRLALTSLIGLGMLSLMAGAFLLPSLQQRLGFFKPSQQLALTTLPAPPTPLPEPIASSSSTVSSAALASAALSPTEPPTDSSQLPVQFAAADLNLARTLWRLKTRTETLDFSFESPQTLNQIERLEQVAETMGLEVTAFNMGMLQLARLSRPCLIEVSANPITTHTTLWVLLRVTEDRVLIYEEPAGATSLSRAEFQQRWFGKLYLSLEQSQYHGGPLAQGMNGTRIQALQKVLQGLGYFPGPASGHFDTQTLQAVKAFQRDNQLVVDGHVGPRTLMMLFHVGGHLLSKTT
ncbi:MAG: AAA family ATPase [Candidatus Tectomicrobia bacterium]|nr:AAA family ATPase [Candidatus Tectomicrobia bacterium]